jgi:hypothetical protein
MAPAEQLVSGLIGAHISILLEHDLSENPFPLSGIML